MEIVVIDGQGGGIGKNIIQVLKEKHPEYTIIGVGTNSMATTQLKKGGADIIATGENAVVYDVKHASIVVGPIGVAFANSMYGEITPAMAKELTSSYIVVGRTITGSQDPLATYKKVYQDFQGE